jgi:glycosyltransferase involved in cell wall biosynthesis
MRSNCGVPMSCRITFVQTHPVQYMAPLFRHIAAYRRDIDLTVLYASMPMPDQQGVGFGEPFEWDVTLTDGYRHRILQPPAPGRRFDSESFRGVDVGSVADAITEARPDVVVVPGWHSAFYLRAIAACRRRGIPVLYRGDSNLAAGPAGIRRPVWAVRTRMALRMFDGYLSVGTRSREYLRDFGVPEPLIFDSPHAIDVSAISSLAAHGERRPVMRRWLGASDADFLVVFAGKFTAVKRAADLVAAAAHLGRDVTLAMVGNGPLMKETRETAQRLGIRATWCGFVNQSTMPSVLAAADCLALPSQAETWGFVVSEALACGTPCVVSDRVGCAPDLIHDGVSGVVHEAGDVDSLVHALSRVREATARGEITRDVCRQPVAAFSFERAAEGIRRGADRVVKRREARGRTAEGQPRVIATMGNMVSVFGLERMSFEVLRTLRENGAAVHCVVNSWQSSRVVDQTDDLGASWSTGYYWYELRRRATLGARFQAAWDIFRTSLDLLGDARRFRPTHVFAPEFNAIVRCAPALWILRRLGVRVVLRLGNAPESGRFYRFLWRHVIDHCVDQYAPNSRFIEQELLGHGIPVRKSRVIYNTVPRRSHVWHPRQPVPGRVIFVGQIIPPKGVDLLLEAIAELRRANVGVTLDIVGDIEGWEHPGYAGYRSGVRARAGRPDLAGCVRFLGLREDVPALLATASVHCLPSRPEQKEGFTVTTLEAKHAGLPSVVTRSGALPEMVRHTVDGWVCSEVTASAIATGLEYFLSDPERARRAGEEARAWERAFSPSRFASEWGDVFASRTDLVASTVRTQPS